MTKPWHSGIPSREEVASTLGSSTGADDPTAAEECSLNEEMGGPSEEAEGNPAGMEVFEYLGALFTCKDRMESETEMDKCILYSTAVKLCLLISLCFYPHLWP